MKKDLTFEQEKRAELLYVLFNGLYICVCIVYCLNFLASVARDSLSFGGFAYNLCSSLFGAVAIIAPFSVYFLRQQKPIKTLFGNKKVSPFFYVFGTFSLTGVSILMLKLSDYLINPLGNAGFIVHETLPSVASNGENVASVIICSLITALAYEFAFRGVITDKLSHANIAAAIIIPTFCEVCLTGSIRYMPYALFSGIILSWLYLKSGSIAVTVTASFIRNIAVYDIYFLSKTINNYIIIASAFVFIASALILIMKFGIKAEMPSPADDDEAYMKMNGKEALKGTLKSFAFWVVLFGAIFAILFFYLSNPNIQQPNNNINFDIGGTNGIIGNSSQQD